MKIDMMYAVAWIAVAAAVYAVVLQQFVIAGVCAVFACIHFVMRADFEREFAELERMKKDTAALERRIKKAKR